MERLRQILPLFASLRGYDRGAFGSDAMAGLTTAIMLVPQAMAYAMLAGLPPEVGLYASMLPLVAYALLGTSRQLAVGPVAMDSLLVASAIAPLAATGNAEYIALALLLAFMTGLAQIGMGVFRLGFLVNFLSQPVVSGFTSAAALIIGLGQLKHLLAVDLFAGSAGHGVLDDVLAQLQHVNLPTVVIGAASIATLVALKRWAPRVPRALVVVAVASLAVWALDLHSAGVPIVGELEAGLPPLALPALDAARVEALLPTALTLALIAFMEAFSVARVFARQNRYDLDANRELIALGAANVAASVSGGYSVTGGFSRTAVNAQAGAKTGVAALVTASIIAVTALFLTPLFNYLPKAVLAAIIVTAVLGLIEVGEVRRLWRVKRSDLVFLVVTFAATLGLGIQQGILIGVATSIGWLVIKTTRPHTAVLGRLPQTTYYRNVKNHPSAERTPGVLALRMDARLYFGNVAHLKRILTSELGADAADGCKAVVVDASSINDLDSSGATALEDLRADLEAQGVTLLLANVKHPVRQVMQRAGFCDRLGADHFFEDVHAAVTHAGDIARACHAGRAPGPGDPPAPASGRQPASSRLMESVK
ncbi:MAG: sodium-independent anion transporter [Deltaproteobacteria bacterium HGW-Deltaproteobacteria-14]|jgi:SulP family sulfate permease|nr:MAG: sodium-independent anion transporter [Deltaproteobacteria bacterium HGW-Deltaproteobacteria-14]